MGKITVYLQDALHNELDEECRTQGLVDNKGRVIRAPIVQKATKYYLTNFKGRKIAEPRVKLRKLVADLIIPQLSEKDVKAWRIQKPHSVEAYKFFIERTSNPPEVKEALCLEVEKSFEETRENALNFMMPEEEPEVKDTAWYIQQMKKTETYNEVRGRLEEIKENERKKCEKQRELERQKNREEAEKRRKKWQKQVDENPKLGLHKKYVDYMQAKADEYNISFLEARRAELGEYDVSLGSVERWQEQKDWQESLKRRLERHSKKTKSNSKHRRKRR